MLSVVPVAQNRRLAAAVATVNGMVLKITLHHGQEGNPVCSCPFALLTPLVADSSLCFALYGHLACPLNLCFHRISPAAISTMCVMTSLSTRRFRVFEILDHIKELIPTV